MFRRRSGERNIYARRYGERHMYSRRSGEHRLSVLTDLNALEDGGADEFVILRNLVSKVAESTASVGE